MRFHTSVVTTLCILTHTSTCLGAAMAFDDARRRYEVAAKGSEERCQTNIASIVNAYGNVLVSIRSDYQRAGNFAATEAILKEQDRLQAEGCLPSSLPASVPEVIDKARIAKELIAKQQQVRDRELYALALRYQNVLRQMLQNLLPQNRMEEARVVNDELTKIQFIAAELGSRLVEHTPEDCTSAPPKEKETDPIQTATAKKPPSGVFPEAEPQLRTWRSRKGTVMEAILVEDKGSRVIFRSKEGQDLQIDRNMLSDEDAMYLDALARKAEEARQRDGMAIIMGIGRTPVECRERLGSPLKEEKRYESPLKTAVTESAFHIKDGFSIVVYFFDGRADCIGVRKLDEDASGIPAVIPQAEIDSMLKANAPEREWKMFDQTSEDTTWITDDGSVFAKYSRTDHILTIATKEYVARRMAKEKSTPGTRQAPVPRVAPPDAGDAPGWPAAPPAIAEPTTAVYGPRQVRSDPSCWGKTIIVRGVASQAGRELDGKGLVILEGILRCRLSGGLAASSGIVRNVISVQGTVVPRPDKVITSAPHMVNCIILGF